MAMQGSRTMDLTLRPARPDDAEECGRVCFEAFAAIADQHNYPRDIPSAEGAAGFYAYLVARPGSYGVVAERDGRIVGSAFVDERSVIVGVSPVTVDPREQGSGVGRRLMEHILDRAASRGSAGVRLVQAAYNVRSFVLYARLGFVVREALVYLEGDPIGAVIAGRQVRPAHEADLAACNLVCRRVHGFERGGELKEAVRGGTATVVEHDGQITGYATARSYYGHAVGQTDDDLKALIGAAPTLSGPGILVPARSALLGWCLDRQLRIVQLKTLMSRGLYHEPDGAFLPSIVF